MYCQNCGSVLSEDARFCQSCGRPQSLPQPPPPPPVTPASVQNQDSPDLTFLQTVRVMNRVYKSVLLLVVLVGIIFFIKGWLMIGFTISIIAVFDFGRRYCFDKGFLIGLDRGYRNGLKKAASVGKGQGSVGSDPSTP